MNELQLVVTKNVAGVLETNIASLEAFVEKRLQQYEPSLYMGDAVMAKKDRAELNHAKTQIADSRKELIRNLMAPYAEFEQRCKTLEKNIDSASAKLDEIVKVKENEEKEAKLSLIENMWKEKNFSLFSLEKVFNQKWLNKSYKLTDIDAELKVLIEKSYGDLKTIERFTDNSEDSELIKAKYLESLDIGDALDWFEEMKKNREKVKIESESRQGREHEEKINEQKRSFAEEASRVTEKAKNAKYAAEALEIPTGTPVKEWVVTFRGTEVQALGVKNFFNMQGIEFNDFNELKF